MLWLPPSAELLLLAWAVDSASEFPVLAELVTLPWLPPEPLLVLAALLVLPAPPPLAVEELLFSALPLPSIDPVLEPPLPPVAELVEEPELAALALD